MAKDSADSNVYTALAFISLVSLLGAIVYMVIRFNQLGVPLFSAGGQ